MTQTIRSVQTAYVPVRQKKKAKRMRDPYDGLRFWSAATHGVGAMAAAVSGVALLVFAARTGGDAMTLGSLAVFVCAMVALYLASCLYHCVNTSVQGRLFLRKLDHAMIYVLIAGTYTPICLGVLEPSVGYGLCAAVWSMAVLGVAITMLWLNAPRLLTTAFYVGMGWTALLALEPLMAALNSTAFFWMLAGGVTYTVGGVLYALKWPCKNGEKFGCHEIFHLFVLAGSVCFYAVMWAAFVA